jgi:hypothetical protein
MLLNVARFANRAGYLLLAFGLMLANIRLAFNLAPTRDLLGRTGLILAAASAVIFALGLVALLLGRRGAGAPRHAGSPSPAR